jgi:heat shock protein HtpX
MASLYDNQDANIRRTWVIMTAFLCVVIGVGYVVAGYAGNPAILWFAVAGSVFMNASAFWFSDKLAIASAGAVAADDVQYRELHRVVENLAITAGLPKPKVYIINDPAPNAFATGRNPEHASIAVTTGLLAIMTRAELEGVLAHELSHIGNRDILVSSVAVVLVGFIAIVADMLWRVSMFGGNDDRDRSPIFLIAGFLIMFLGPLVAQLMQLAISRKREYLADASGALLTRYPEGLASALQKIGNYAAPMQRASSATAHLFISNPFGAGAVSGFMRNLFSTHPPIEARVKALLDH